MEKKMYKSPKLKINRAELDAKLLDTSTTPFVTPFNAGKVATYSSSDVKSVGSGFATGGEQFGGGIEDW